MYELDELYEPDEILMDIDIGDANCQDDELHELSFENECEAADEFSYLIGEVESPQELFAMG